MYMYVCVCLHASIHVCHVLFFVLFVCLSGTFLLLHAYMFLMFLRDHMSWDAFKDLFIGLVFIAGGVVALVAVFLMWAGEFGV